MEYSLCNKWFNEINKGNRKKLLHIHASIFVSLLKQFFFILAQQNVRKQKIFKNFLFYILL